MATLAEARQAVADALNGVGPFNVSPRITRYPKAMDGYVIVQSIEPASFGSCRVTLTAVILLSPDEYAAEGLMETYAVPLVNAVTQAVPFADFSAETVSVPVNDATFFTLALTLSTEVS